MAEVRRSKRKVSVTFVDEVELDSIKQITEESNVDVVPLSERGSARRSTRMSTNGNINSIELPPLEEAMEEGDVFYKPTTLLEDEENSISGSRVFSFNTPKKRNAMMEKVDSAKKFGHIPTTPKTPKTPKSAMKQVGTPKTPKSALKQANTPKSASKSVTIGNTPSSKTRRSLLPEVVDIPKTPYSFRKRVSKRIQKIVCNEDSSSEDDSDFELSESSDDDSTKENNMNERNKTPSKTPSKTPTKTPTKAGRQPKTPAKTPSKTPSKGRRRKGKDVDMVADTDEYFTANSEQDKITTSDHTLGRLSTPRLAPDVLKSLLSDLPSIHASEIKTMIEEHVADFHHWMTLLCEGFSLFLYGLGSKRNIISQFQQMFLNDFDHLVINGYFPSLTIKSILNNITSDILEYEGSFHSVQDQLDYIRNHYSDPAADQLFLLIHNLDGAMLRPEKAQIVLAHLAKAPKICVLASIDHINAPLIFDGSKVSQYNAIWWDATTLTTYSEETGYENSLMVHNSGSLALSSLIHVFKSLTPNAKGIFLLLARYQLDQKDNSNYRGMVFNDMYQRCREAFLVNSDLTLRAQLTEFRDHKLLNTKKGPDGSELLLIPLEASTLQEFVEQQEQEGL